MSYVIVEISSGMISGKILKSIEGVDYCAFMGIPYAEPPIGHLRFKDPVPIKKWNGIKYTIKYESMCAQCNIYSQTMSGTEDCLYLNVFVKNLNANDNKAVMVWIHGGGFYFGDGSDLFYGPDYLIEKNIVLVTINYRLGVFGFLNLEDEIAPGNQGFKDIVLALQWVQNNIKKFGGNPDNVTIFGESSGGAAVHYLTLSPLAQGLFHKAISQSGVALNPWSFIEKPKEKAILLCSLLGEDLENPLEILLFLKMMDYKELQEMQEKMRKSTTNFPFGPGVDDKSSNPFMPYPVEEIAEQGVHVPYLVGYNSREGISFLTGKNRKELFKMMNSNFRIIFDEGTHRILKRNNLSTEQIRRLYFKNSIISEENCDVIADLIGDVLFVEGIHKFLKIQAEKSTSSTFFYKLSYDSKCSLAKCMLTMPPPSGASHFDDINYLFKMKYFEVLNIPFLKEGTEDYLTMKRMTELWTNFAKYGKPTVSTSKLIPVHWLPINDGTVLQYLNIDKDLSMKSMTNIENKYLAAQSIEV